MKKSFTKTSLTGLALLGTLADAKHVEKRHGHGQLRRGRDGPVGDGRRTTSLL